MQKQSQVQSKNSQKRKQQKSKLEFSKRLTIVDIICWAVITILLLVVMLFQPGIATYCVNIFNAATAAYVSLRLGYTAKAGVENYKKISQNYQEIANSAPVLEEDSNG